MHHPEKEIAEATAYALLFFSLIIPSALAFGWVLGKVDDLLSRWYDKYLRRH